MKLLFAVVLYLNILVYNIHYYDNIILKYIKVNGSINSSEAMEILDLGKTRAYEKLRNLVEKGIIKKIGSGKATKYLLK